MLFGCILLLLLLGSLLYTIYINQKTESTYTSTPLSHIEGFYPRRWWGGHHGTRWAWRRPWMHSWGNWRPYGYYPAYSGYWKQCEPSGTWCPATRSCNSPECQ